MALIRNEDLERLAVLATRLAGMYADAEQQIQARIAREVEHAAVDGDFSAVARALNLGAMQRTAEDVVRALRSASTAELAAILEDAAAAGSTAAVNSLPESLRTPTAAVPGAGGIAAIAVELAGVTATAQARILRLPDDVFRQAAASSVTGLLGGALGSSQEAQAAAWQRIIATGATFRDSAGRRWNTASYVEMATRTATQRAYTAQHTTTLTAAGVTLQRVVIGREACEECARWAGKILRSDAGPTGRVQVPSLTGPGTVTVNIAGTIDEAEASGWHHPNCRCTLVGYVPGTRPPTVPDTTYDPAAEAARARLRALERRVRAAKTNEAAAVTPEQRTAARARVRAIQAEIRDHVAAHDTLTRERNREQINFGHR